MPWVISTSSTPAPFDFTFAAGNIHFVPHKDTTFVFYKQELIGRVSVPKAGASAKVGKKKSKKIKDLALAPTPAQCFIPMTPDYKFDLESVEIDSPEEVKPKVEEMLNKRFTLRKKRFKEIYSGATRVAVYDKQKCKLYYLDAALVISTKITKTVTKHSTLESAMREVSNVLQA